MKKADLMRHGMKLLKSNLMTKAVLILGFLTASLTCFSQLDSLKSIEYNFSPQWDFCTCVVKNDSMNKALMQGEISDNEFDVLMKRVDVIDKKCNDFLIYKVETPEERKEHKDRVMKCLNASEIKD